MRYATLFITAIAVAAFAGGCGKKSSNQAAKPAAAATAKAAAANTAAKTAAAAAGDAAAAKQAGAATAAKAAKSSAADDKIPAPEDFEGQASKDINAKNLSKDVSQMDKEVGK